MISSNILWHKYVLIKLFKAVYTKIAVKVPGSSKSYVSLMWIGFYAYLCFKALQTHAIESGSPWKSEGYCLAYMFTSAWNNVVSQAEWVKTGGSTHTKLGSMWWFVDTKPVLADQVQGDLFNYIIFHCDYLAQDLLGLGV